MPKVQFQLMLIRPFPGAGVLFSYFVIVFVSKKIRFILRVIVSMFLSSTAELSNINTFFVSYVFRLCMFLL